jgi:hypothetical protein
MNTSDFIKTVKAMREAQTEYFRTRTATPLQRSKELERKVDEMIKDYESKQIKLF